MRPLYLLLIVLLFQSCSNSDNNAPDVSDIKVDVKVERFEKDFFALDTTRLDVELQALNKQYPQFLSFYLQQILRLPPGSPELSRILAAYNPINDSIQEKYGAMGWLKDELSESFRYVKHYFPQYKEPRVITFIGTFDAPGVILTPQYLGIGLHQYAGKNFSVYQDPQLLEVYPTYISRRFDREYIVSNSMKAVVDDLYPDTSAGRPLIEQMIEKGKQWYLLNLFLPGAPDSVKTGYTGKQLDWLKSNEGNVWGYISSNVDIYTIDPIIVQDYIGEAPFTRGMPEGFAPGNIGQWVGLRIVQKYMEQKKDLNPRALMSTPAATIFQEAKYKPK